MYTITIDPGCRKSGGGTGVAVFKEEKLHPVKTFCAVSSQEDFYDRVELICYDIYTRIEGLKLASANRCIYIEEPEFFSSFKGLTAASSGSLFKLICFYGALFNELHVKWDVKPLKINKWKGQLSKDKVAQRVKAITGQEYGGDVCDAVGMGLHLKGLM